LYLSIDQFGIGSDIKISHSGTVNSGFLYALLGLHKLGKSLAVMQTNKQSCNVSTGFSPALRQEDY
jgi:hypothetical protein